MSILDSVKKLQEYGNNSKNGYMNNVFLDIIQQKQRLGKSLNQKERDFLDNYKRKKPLEYLIRKDITK